MKKITVLIIFLAMIMTGCSYEVIGRNSQHLQGENENWKVDYKIDFITDYPKEDGKVFAHRITRQKITVTYQKDLSDLSDVKHMEITYEDSFGEGGHRSEDFDSPPDSKQFKFGGDSGSSFEATDYVTAPENLSQSIMIFSGPSYEMRTNANATVTIQIDGQTDTIRLSPEKDPSQRPALLEQINNKLSKKPFLRFFSGHASDLLLKLEKANVRIITDKTISGSIEVTEGENKGQELVPTDLYYEFTIRNDGNKTIIGDFNDLQVKIVPNDHLVRVSKEIVGINLYDTDSAFGGGESISGDIFSPHSDCEIALLFDLSREYPQGTLITPSEEDLKKLLDNATDSSLIVTYKNEEAAHFDLSDR